MRISIRTITHSMQRYDTAGDWWFSEGPDEPELVISVSALGDWRMEALVAIHELTEAVLCRDQGIDERAVDRFDTDPLTVTKSYTVIRDDEQGHVMIRSELGDIADAPYRNEHCFATSVERMLCAAMNIAWSEYEARINALELKPTP